MSIPVFEDYNPRTPITAEFLNAVSQFVYGGALPDGAGLLGFSHASTYTAGTLGAKEKLTINVKDAPYNAVGDGVADDTAAVQAALTALPNGYSLNFAGAYCRLTQPLRLTGKSNVRLEGMGGGVTRDFSGSLTRCMIVTGCTNVHIDGMRFVGGNGAAVASAGEDDLLVIGNPDTTAADSFNQDIYVTGCKFIGGAHGGVNVYGNFGTSALVKNTNVYIIGNVFDSCSWGFWAYKNARRVFGRFNIITNCGNGGFVADTLAQGDVSRLNTEPCYEIHYDDNVVDTTGLVVGAGARGGLIKGNITGFSMVGNTFRNIGTVGSAADSFGWLVTNDFNNAVAAEGEVNENTVDTVVSAGSGFIGAISRGAQDIQCLGNIGKNSPSGMLLEGINRCNLKSSILSNITVGFPIYVGAPGTNTLVTKFNGEVSGNIVEKFAANGNVAIVIGAETLRCHLGVNQLETFTAGLRLFRNASATGVTGERIVTSYAAVAYDPPAVANGATDSAVVNTLVGAVVGDSVNVAFSLDMSGCTYQGYMTAANTARIILTNNTGAPVDLGAGTVYVTTERSTLVP